MKQKELTKLAEAYQEARLIFHTFVVNQQKDFEFDFGDRIRDCLYKVKKREQFGTQEFKSKTVNNKIRIWRSK